MFTWVEHEKQIFKMVGRFYNVRRGDNVAQCEFFNNIPVQCSACYGYYGNTITYQSPFGMEIFYYTPERDKITDWIYPIKYSKICHTRALFSRF